jgi:hypothetical protein
VRLQSISPDPRRRKKRQGAATQQIETAGDGRPDASPLPW